MARKFDRVQSVRLYEGIVEQVEAAIACGELAPGDHLPSERELVVQFGASRPTVREALRVLESNGVVRSRAGDPLGPEILPFSPDALQKQVARMVHTESVSTAALITFRMILDGSGAQLAAQLRTEEQLRVMETCIEAMAGAIDRGYQEFGRADVAFHDAVAAATGNPLLSACNDVVRSLVVSLISDKVAASADSRALMEESLVHHREVLVAIQQGDGLSASRVSCRNLYDYYRESVPVEDQFALGAMLHPDDLAQRRAAARSGR